MTTIILLFLVVVTFFLVKPIILSILLGIILAFILLPVYEKTNKFLKSPNISATIICTCLIIIILLPVWFLTPIAIEESIKIYMASQQMDFVGPLKAIFPSFFASETFSNEVGSILHSFVTRITNSITNMFAELILNFPTLFLKSLVVIFTFFFVLRDNEKFVGYIESLLPFSKDLQKNLFDSSREITLSVLYGQIVIGIFQGIVAGIGFFIFNVPNSLMLTLLACAAGIFPIIGTGIIWVPVVVYLFVAGNTFSAVGVTIIGIISSSVDNFLRPVFISKRTKLNSSLVLIGMIGGLFMFGILGIILGPLILAYLFIILEVYRDKRVPGVFTKQE